jgi:hypothetical protein
MFPFSNVYRYSNFAKVPEGFQSSHKYRKAPGPTDSEQVLVNDGAVLLVGGDDKQDTAVYQELHAEVFVLREKILFNDGLQNLFLSYVLLSEVNQSSSCLS